MIGNAIKKQPPKKEDNSNPVVKVPNRSGLFLYKWFSLLLWFP